MSETYSLFKIMVSATTDQVVGVYMATNSVGEMIQEVDIVVNIWATKADFVGVLGIHLTSAEKLVTLRTPSFSYKDGKNIED